MGRGRGKGREAFSPVVVGIYTHILTHIYTHTYTHILYTHTHGKKGVYAHSHSHSHAHTHKHNSHDFLNYPSSYGHTSLVHSPESQNIDSFSLPFPGFPSHLPIISCTKPLYSTLLYPIHSTTRPPIKQSMTPFLPGHRRLTPSTRSSG